MKNTGKVMKFAVAMFGILMASPTVWGQVHSDENGFGPFGTKGESEMLEFIVNGTRDAADTVTKLEAAAEEVEQNKPPHFGTLPSVAAVQYKQATSDIEKSLDLTFPSSALTLNP